MCQFSRVIAQQSWIWRKAAWAQHCLRLPQRDTKDSMAVMIKVRLRLLLATHRSLEIQNKHHCNHMSRRKNRGLVAKSCDLELVSHVNRPEFHASGSELLCIYVQSLSLYVQVCRWPEFWIEKLQIRGWPAQRDVILSETWSRWRSKSASRFSSNGYTAKKHQQQP